MKNDLKSCILSKITSEEVAPKPSWYFTVREYCVWGSAIALFAVASVAGGFVLYTFSNAEFLTPLDQELGMIKGLAMFSFVWLLAAAILGAITVLQYEHTKRGYKYSNIVLFSIVLSALVLTSGLLFSLGAMKHADERLDRMVPSYASILDMKQERLHTPREGRLVGHITDMIATTTVYLETPDNTWVVTLPKIPMPPHFEDHVRIDKPFVFVVGEQTGNNTFVACSIKKIALAGDRPFWKPSELERTFEVIRTTTCERVKRRFEPVHNPAQEFLLENE